MAEPTNQSFPLLINHLPPAPFFSFQAMDSARLASKEGGLSRGTGGLMTQAGFWEGWMDSEQRPEGGLDCRSQTVEL